MSLQIFLLLVIAILLAVLCVVTLKFGWAMGILCFIIAVSFAGFLIATGAGL